ncbi:MAG TPA: PAS domain-containing protein [Thermoplasmata archaeon]
MAQTTPSPAAQSKPVPARTVLVIDGNEEHAILSVTALGRKGYRVSSADTGKEGVRMALARPFDAIVLGHKLRDSTGIEVLRILVDKLPRTPKIFVVAPDAEDAALRAMETGAHSYIVKTPRYTELLPAMVEDQVQEAENRRRLEENDKEQAQVVTERKTVEEKLSRSESRLRVVLKQAPILLWTTDVELRVTSATGAGLLRLESLNDRPKGLSLYEYFDTRDRDIEPILSHLRALSGESVSTEIEWVGRVFDVQIEPLRSPEGAVIGTIGVAFDVTERKRTEESLRLSEERFHLLGRATNDVVWDWDLQTDGQWVNENVTTLFGYPAEEIEPTGVWWTAHIHPDDRDRVEESLQDVIKSGVHSWSAEYRFRRRDGTYATVVDRGYVIHDKSAGPVRVVGSVMDVTKERRAEAIQSAVYRISEATHSAKGLPELYRQIHKIIGGLMPAANFYIALHDEKTDTLSFPYFVDEEESPPPPQKLGRGLTEYVLRTRRPLLASPEVFEGLVRKGEVISIGPPSVDWVGAPLMIQGKTIGVIVVQSYTEGVRFTEEDKAILNFVSEQVAMAIDRKGAQERLAQTTSELQAIF